MLLEARELETFYGKSQVLRGVSFEVPRGQITALLGRNGAGKTTTLRSIMGLTPPRRGSVRFDGRDITGEPPHIVFRLGVGYVPEGRQIFPHLDVGENLRLAERSRDSANRWTLDRIFEYFPVLRQRWRQRGQSLSGGEQQMLAIARALMAEPRLLLLDEPSLGLAPLLVEEIFRIIREIHDNGTTVLLVEQNANKALSIADYGYVLETGMVSLAGDSRQLLRDDHVRRSYLGHR
jgi:branched-chain amino acid transport system ATP-binding protein